MKQSALKDAEIYAKAHRRKKQWYKAVTGLACVVVFCTVYALILPAITLENSSCETPEHTLSLGCYIQVTSASKKMPVCNAETLEIHQHTDDCYDGDGNLICGYADFVIHQHDASCYDENGNLWCTLPEVEAHQHTSACYAQPKTTSETIHTHTDECYATNRGKLICTEHVHTADCYTETSVLTCTEDHEHDESCYEISRRLTCGYDGDHQHTDECYEPERVLICTLPTELTEAEKAEIAEGAEPKLICGKEEIIPHEHTSDCFDEYGNLICGKIQIIRHQHSKACFAVFEGTIASDTNPVAKPIDLNYKGNSLVDITAKLHSEMSMAGVLSLYSGGINISDYVNEHDGNFSLIILNVDGTQIPKDENGRYLVIEGQEYKLSMEINSPNGFEPGTYIYKLPEGVVVNADSGDFFTSGEVIGSWTIDSSGYMKFTFNEKADDYTNVNISSSMGLMFNESEKPIDFDGNISIIVRSPEEQNWTTKVNKNGKFLPDKQNPNQIQWTIDVENNEKISLVGKAITDEIVQFKSHHYSDEDKAAGITVIGTDPEGTEYTWILTEGSDGFAWTRDKGWTYTFPETVITEGGQSITLGAGWDYSFTYNTTITEKQENGTTFYRNQVETANEANAKGSLSLTQGTITSGVDKTGILTDNGKFHWTITANFSGSPDNNGRYKSWRIYDYMKIIDSQNHNLSDDSNLVGTKGLYRENLPENMKVTLTKTDGTEVVLTRYNSADPPDTSLGYCYTFVPGGSTHKDRWDIYLLTPCQCTPETCGDLSKEGSECVGAQTYGQWCKCWTETEPVTVIVEYDTPAKNAMEYYGNMGNKVRNNVELYNRGTFVTSDRFAVPIPGVFKKTEVNKPGEDNNYMASFSITVNEAKLDLNQDGEPLTIVDTMSETLVYVPGNMVITTEDGNGQEGQLTYNTDYTLEYDAASHKITVTIQNPGPLKYTLKYDAQVILPENSTTVEYYNTASVKLFGGSITSGINPITITDIKASSEQYTVYVNKFDGGTNRALGGATIGLFSANGEMIASDTTDSDGKLIFQTKISSGILFRPHTLYYIQEIEAPEHYQLDNTKHWFFFCDKAAECDECTALMADLRNAQRIGPDDDLDNAITVVNTRYGYELPNTGGIGTKLYTLGGLTLMLCAKVLLLYNKKRRKKDI